MTLSAGLETMPRAGAAQLRGLKNLRRTHPIMPKSIEDVLVCSHDEPDQDEHTKLGRIAREVDAHLVPFGRYTARERVRIGKAWGRSLASALRT